MIFYYLIFLINSYICNYHQTILNSTFPIYNQQNLLIGETLCIKQISLRYVIIMFHKWDNSDFFYDYNSTYADKYNKMELILQLNLIQM